MIINGPQFSGAILHSVNYSVMGWVGQNFPICKMKREAHLHLFLILLIRLKRHLTAFATTMKLSLNLNVTRHFESFTSSLRY